MEKQGFDDNSQSQSGDRIQRAVRPMNPSIPIPSTSRQSDFDDDKPKKGKARQGDSNILCSSFEDAIMSAMELASKEADEFTRFKRTHARELANCQESIKTQQIEIANLHRENTILKNANKDLGGKLSDCQEAFGFVKEFHEMIATNLQALNEQVVEAGVFKDRVREMQSKSEREMQEKISATAAQNQEYSRQIREYCEKHYALETARTELEEKLKQQKHDSEVSLNELKNTASDLLKRYEAAVREADKFRDESQAARMDTGVLNGKLQLVMNELAQLLDTKTELERKLHVEETKSASLQASIESQAKQLKELEHTRIKNETEINKEKSQLQNQLKSANEQLNITKLKLDDIESYKNTLEEQFKQYVSEKTQELEALQKENQQIKIHESDIVGELNSCKEVLATMVEERAQYQIMSQKQVTTAKAQLTELNASLIAITHDMSELQSYFVNTADELNTHVNSLTQHGEVLETANKCLVCKVEEGLTNQRRLEADVAEKINIITELREQQLQQQEKVQSLEFAQERCNELQKIVDEMHEEMHSKEEKVRQIEIDQSETVAQLGHEIEGLKCTIQTKDKENNEVAIKLEHMEQEYAKCADELKRQISALETELNNIKKTLDEKNNTIENDLLPKIKGQRSYIKRLEDESYKLFKTNKQLLKRVRTNGNDENIVFDEDSRTDTLDTSSRSPIAKKLYQRPTTPTFTLDSSTGFERSKTPPHRLLLTSENATPTTSPRTPITADTNNITPITPGHATPEPKALTPSSNNMIENTDRPKTPTNKFFSAPVAKPQTPTIPRRKKSVSFSTAPPSIKSPTDISSSDASQDGTEVKDGAPPRRQQRRTTKPVPTNPNFEPTSILKSNTASTGKTTTVLSTIANTMIEYSDSDQEKNTSHPSVQRKKTTVYGNARRNN